MLDVPGRHALVAYLAADKARTQVWLAKVLQVGQSTISLWVRGQARPGLVYCIGLQYLAGIPVDSWLTDEERQQIATVSVDAHRILLEQLAPKPVKTDPRQIPLFPVLDAPPTWVQTATHAEATDAPAPVPTDDVAVQLPPPEAMHGAADEFGGQDTPHSPAAATLLAGADTKMPEAT